MRERKKVAFRATFTKHNDIRIQRDVDRELYGKEHVITSDSIILDHCVSWVNLLSACVARTGADVLKVWDDPVPQKYT